MKLIPKRRRFPVLAQYNLTVRTCNGIPFLGGPVRVLQTVAGWGKETRFARWFAN